MVTIEGYKVPKMCTEETLKKTFKKIVEDERSRRLQRSRTLWRLRWRYACRMYDLFEALEFRNAPYFYTADAIDPSMVRMDRYKKTPREWMDVWRDVADRILKKLKEVNLALKED